MLKDGKILLGRRDKEPNRGKWVLPGGKIEFGETHQQAAAREAQEELGIEVRPVRLAGKGVYHLIDEEHHRIIVYNIVEYVSGEVIPASDTSEARFFTKEELSTLEITPVVRSVLRDEGFVS